MTSKPAFYVKKVEGRWGQTEYAVIDWTDRCVTTKTTEAAALDAVDRLYTNLRNYGDAVEAGLDVEDIDVYPADDPFFDDVVEEDN